MAVPKKLSMGATFAIAFSLAANAQVAPPELSPASSPLANPSAPPPGIPASPVAVAFDSAPLPAYQLSLKFDLPALGIMGVMATTRLFATGHADCAPLCDESSVNPIDRLTAGFYDERWENVSNIALYAFLGGTATAIFVDEGFVRGVNDGTVVTESVLGAAAISSVLTLAARRPRPYLYSTLASVPARSGTDGEESFLSGHTAAVVAGAAALFITERRLHPNSYVPWIVLAVSGSAAMFISVARVMAGEHFISDDALGAVAGLSTGVLFPLLHDQPVHVTTLVSDTQKGVALAGSF